MKKQILQFSVLFVALLIFAWWMSASVYAYPDCLKALNPETYNEDMYAPYICTIPVEGKRALVTISDKDGASAVEIKKGKDIIFATHAEVTEEEKVGLDVLYYYTEDEPTVAPGALLLQDVTYDGYDDLVLLSYSGPYNFAYKYFAYHPETGTFGNEPLLEAVNPSVDANEQTIIEFNKSRGMGDEYIANLFKYMEGKYVLLESIQQNQIDRDHPEKGYVLIRSEKKGEELIEVERTYPTYEEVWGEPYIPQNNI